MAIEVSTLPGGAGFILSVAAYVGLSVLAGQEIGEREIDALGWQALCEIEIKTEIDNRRTPKSVVPEARCSDIFAWLGPDAVRLCKETGDIDFNVLERQAEAKAHARKKALKDKLLGRLAAKAGTQCGCAAEIYQTENMMSLAVYAGSARLIIPPSVGNLERTLKVALATPQCVAIAEATS